MNDAAQIRRCSGALGANPSPLQIQDSKFSNREPLSNRESLRLEIQLPNTKRKHRHSNREKSHPFQVTINSSKSTVRGRGQLHSKIPNFQLLKRAKSIKKHPQSLFRLESIPLLCFQQLTQILIEPMFRLERQKSDREINQKAGIKSPAPNLKLTIYATITSGPPQPARRDSRKAKWQ
jgi:hypothetical protein